MARDAALVYARLSGPESGLVPWRPARDTGWSHCDSGSSLWLWQWSQIIRGSVKKFGHHLPVVELTMGADQIAAIRPAIAELESAASNSEGEFIARFEVPGRDKIWTEVILGTVNVGYPYADDPLKRLRRHRITPLPKLKLSDWQSELFATFGYDPTASSRDVAKFVDRVIGEMLGAGTDYEVDVTIERIAD